MSQRGVVWWLMAILIAAGCGKDKDTGKAPTASDGEKPSAEKPKANAAAKDFGVESARITFKYTGQEEGTVTAWFTDHGDVVVLLRDMTKPQAEKHHFVWKNKETLGWKDGGKPYTSKFRVKDSELRLISTVDPRQLKMGGYTQRANEVVAGKDCEVWRSDKTNVAVWRWQGIDLKYENGAGGEKVIQSVEATEVVSPSEIPSEMMTPPAN